MLTSDDIKARAIEVGFDLCGIAPADAFPELRFFQEWLARGYAGQMQYLARTADARADVRQVLPSAQSVIVMGTVYNVDRPYSIEEADPCQAKIARYAWGDDYHQVLKHRLEALLNWMRERSDQPFEAHASVDTGPIQERVYARHAGIGWIGKNTCVINPELGSWVFLSSIICSLPLVPDPPAFDLCGTCTLCLEACPTAAIREPWVLDATRCLSYLTIELRGDIPVEMRDAMGSHVYGCDICQEVCPWNQVPARATDPVWLPRAPFDRPLLTDLWRQSDRELRTALRGSAMKRTRVAGLRRNTAVALGNSGSAGALESLERAYPREDSRGSSEVVEHVRWASGKLKR